MRVKAVATFLQLLGMLSVSTVSVFVCFISGHKMLCCLKKSLSFVWHSAAKPYGALKLQQVSCVADVSRRLESNYNAYPTFDTPSPYKPRTGIRRKYEYKLYKGGL